ncbi:hypothetical protein PIROE2DRAFT_21593 [Piromyces sp. E2]|nr:hypothetical protein PIROE2DRAFT_21593 [Piromyces sp. E2]|eukprot:OUM56693.1 hypothetical protein PIROE2DRAFT_21593 [Piromyces sp. E2]
MYVTNSEFNEYTNIYNIPSVQNSYYYYNTHRGGHESLMSTSPSDHNNLCHSPSSMCSSPPNIHTYSLMNHNEYESLPRLGRRRSSALLIPYPSVLETIKEVDEY